MRRHFILLSIGLLSTFSSLNAEKIVQCIANFSIDADFYTQALKKRGYDGRVVVVNAKDYEEALLKKNGKWLEKLHLGFLNQVKLPKEVDKIIFFNLTSKVARRYDLSRLPKEKLVLFMWEPKTVLRRMYQPKIQNRFSHIYTWDDSLIDGKTHFKFHYPVLCPMLAEIPSFEEKKLCTLVASNLNSNYENELYSQRKVAIGFFEKIGEAGFEFYGRKWDPSEYKSYRGPIADKLGTIKNYRFSICYENTHGTQGYVTEKIFDCFAAGNVPVYWGASNIEEYIPKDCFIDRRSFATMEELYAFLKGMKKEEYDGYIARIKVFLNSDAAQRFALAELEEVFYQAVVRN